MDKTANRIITTFRVDFVAAVSLISLTFLFATTLVPDTVSAASHTLSLTSSGAQSINATGAGGAVISSDSINVATTCRSGYNFTINTSVNNNNLYLGGDASKNESGKYFTPADGTTTLANSTNTWGYYYNASDPSTTPTSSNIFSPVPTLSNPATIISPLSAPSSTDINDNFNIYYGVSVSPTMPVGTYKMIPDTNNSNNDGTIVYTATIAEACTKYTVHFNPSSYFEGNLITGTGTMSDQSIFEGVSTALTSNGFTAPTISGTQYYFAGWNTAQDGSGTTYTDGQSVTDLTSAGNTITLYAMWTDCPGGKICYSANVANSSDVTGSMGNQNVSSSATSVTLYAPNYKHDGYGFASWNTKKDGTGTNYGPQQTIKFTAGQYSTGGLKLYANWITSAGSLQNWSGCSSMNIGDVTALKDTRDNNVYAVAKLADGKCWTIENLRLDDSAELSSTNTHNPSLPLNNSWYYKNQRGTLSTSNYLSATSDPTSTDPDTAWCQTNSSACDDQSMLATNNTTFFTNNTASSYSASSNVYSYGNYYNWYSATAGHGKYENGSGYVASGDICPAGWHLPKGGNKSQESTNEFWQLIVTGLNGGTNPANYDSSTYPYYAGTEATPVSNALRSYPNNFVYSGYVNGSSVYNRNSHGDYWSASGYSSLYAYYLYFFSSNFYPGTGSDNKYDGRMARCVAGN
ncbi:InlB B-repeat-containing protein [Candidatus Saccharibacteria bacterium]|nr:InlB B-repeat-containing protein [Candidatus Saccharibacteria bacterium]